MRFTRHGSVHRVAGIIGAAGFVVAACGGDDSTDTSSTPFDAGSETSSGGSSSGSTATDGGGRGGDAAGDGAAGTKNAGESCKDASECKSGQCFKGDYCTITCTMKDATDPACKALGGKFDGTCNKQGFCTTK